MNLTQTEFTPIVIFNAVVFIFFTLAYFYQVIYLLVAARKGSVVLPDAKEEHTFAFVIAAHNEESVIANLVKSIKNQEYPADRIDVFVIADACTDNTADEARRAGAITWERNDLARKGKSWVLDYAFNRILNEYGDKYEGYFVFDADNILSPTYVKEMNKLFDMGYLVGTSYRNSKNFGSSWISAANALWFIREARFLNNPRMMLGASCAISGSGWMVSQRIVRGMHGWDFHTLTEDIQFSTFCAANGITVGYAPAEFYDEQPIDFKSSWIQRMRWTKGFYQVFFSYAANLLTGIRKGHFPAYDMFMVIAPGMILTILSFLVNFIYLLIGVLSQGFFATGHELVLCTASLIMAFLSMYIVFFLLAIITTIAESDHIYASKWCKIKNVFTFPIFMMSYIPITVVALFKKVEWVPTKHTVSVDFDAITEVGKNN